MGFGLHKVEVDEEEDDDGVDDEDDEDDEDRPLVAARYHGGYRERELNAPPLFKCTAASSVCYMVLGACLATGVSSIFYPHALDWPRELIHRSLRPCPPAIARAECPGPFCLQSEAELVIQTNIQLRPVPAMGKENGTDEIVHGHEWAGGAVGGAERLGAAERWGKQNQQPQNATLLLMGILTYAPNFGGRDSHRRALWRQQPWRLGIGSMR